MAMLKLCRSPISVVRQIPGVGISEGFVEIAHRRHIDAVIVTHNDRLTSFSFEYLEELFSAYDVEWCCLSGRAQGLHAGGARSTGR